MIKPKRFSPSKVTGAKAFKKKRLYDTPEWTTYSRKFLALNDRCYACGNRAEIVDHVVAHKGNEEKFWNETNFIPLCKKDHDYITGKFDSPVVPKTEEKMQWIANRRMETETSVRVKIVRRT